MLNKLRKPIRAGKTKRNIKKKNRAHTSCWAQKTWNRERSTPKPQNLDQRSCAQKQELIPNRSKKPKITEPRYQGKEKYREGWSYRNGIREWWGKESMRAERIILTSERSESEGSGSSLAREWERARERWGSGEPEPSEIHTGVREKMARIYGFASSRVFGQGPPGAACGNCRGRHHSLSPACVYV